MPFNRVDYYLSRPVGTFPTRCFSGSFILYRTTINHGDGNRGIPQPIVDCTMDFQVAFGLDTDADGAIDTWARSLAGLSAAQIRARVREVRVFVLFHEGQRDDNFRFSGTLSMGDNATGIMSTYTPTGNATRYRWKIVKLAVKPMNLE